MRTTTYFGEYRSSTLSQTGCVKRFVTTESDSILFPPQIEYSCDLCSPNGGKPLKHSFGLVRTWAVHTDRQAKDFAKYCDENLIETDVSII